MMATVILLSSHHALLFTISAPLLNCAAPIDNSSTIVLHHSYGTGLLVQIGNSLAPLHRLLYITMHDTGNFSQFSLDRLHFNMLLLLVWIVVVVGWGEGTGEVVQLLLFARLARVDGGWGRV